MGANFDEKLAGKLEADPNLYKLDSVMGSVTCDGRAVKGATVTITKSGEVVPVADSGAYIVVLDPVSLRTRHHELVFAAPGHETQKHEVLVPDKQQLRLDVELKRAV